MYVTYVRTLYTYVRAREILTMQVVLEQYWHRGRCWDRYLPKRTLSRVKTLLSHICLIEDKLKTKMRNHQLVYMVF